MPGDFGWLTGAVLDISWGSQGILCQGCHSGVVRGEVAIGQDGCWALHAEDSLAGQLKLVQMLVGET